MLYGLTSVVRYHGGVLGAIDCPLRDPNGALSFNGAALPSAAIQLTENAFGIFHFDVPFDPALKIKLLERFGRPLSQINFEGVTSVFDVASRCSGQLSQRLPQNELATIPPVGIIVAGVSTSPARRVEVIGLHTHRRTDPNRPFSQLTPFLGNCYGGNAQIAQFLDAKVFSGFFSREQALRMVYLIYQVSQRSFQMQQWIGPGVEVVEVANGVAFRNVPQDELETTRKAATVVHQKLMLSCRRLSGTLL